MEKKQEKPHKQESPKKSHEKHGKSKKDSLKDAVAGSLSKTTNDQTMKNRILEILMGKKWSERYLFAWWLYLIIILASIIYF